MFRKINKDTIKQAVRFRKDLNEQLQECRRYRTAYGFCVFVISVALGSIILFDARVEQKTLLCLGILFVSIMRSSLFNNSRQDVLEAIAAIRNEVGNLEG